MAAIVDVVSRKKTPRFQKKTPQLLKKTPQLQKKTPLLLQKKTHKNLFNFIDKKREKPSFFFAKTPLFIEKHHLSIKFLFKLIFFIQNIVFHPNDPIHDFLL